MKVLDAGHQYRLAMFDGDGGHTLRFMKREGPGYPGNIGSYPGTNCQEVIRALIDRVIYLDNQIPCDENTVIIRNLREALLMFEIRALKRHKYIEKMVTCETCGHIACEHQ